MAKDSRVYCTQGPEHLSAIAEGALSGKNLFKVLREFDALEVDIIYSFYFDENDLGLALMNRLKKAAGFNIVTIDN